MKTMNLTTLKIDELNSLLRNKISDFGIEISFTSPAHTWAVRERLSRELEDTMLDYLIYAYAMGVHSAEEDLGKTTEINAESMDKSINARTGGKTYKERLLEKAKKGDFSNIDTLGETEFIRVMNDGILDAGKQLGAKAKTWQTMLDDRVRDTHDYLEGVTVPFDAEFYTFDGDHAKAPHGFELPENNINCRCLLKLG